MASKLPAAETIWGLLGRIISLTLGILIGAVSVVVFYVPAQVAPAGITGISMIANTMLNTPIGLVTLLLNIPILYLAFRMLGGWQMLASTVYVVFVYSFAIDFLTPYLPVEGVSDNQLLNAIFAGVVGGIGGGFVLRGGGTFGGTSTLGRILQVKFGFPLSSTYLYTNIAVVILAGVVLGWESALFALVALVMEGMTSDYLLEGPSVIRTVVVITDKPQEVSQSIITQLGRGVTSWQATGMYTGEPRHMLYVVVNRAQVNSLRQVIMTVDERAFIVVGQGHVAYGEGFRSTKA
jgi:uncharacterized membrane-anchored protein YitT (DUF2179 family)